jgi:hypothetical protein
MANPYELWQTHTLLGVMRDVKAEDWYFGQFFTRQMRSTDEYIDFEKLPIRSRKLAPFVRPLARGRGVFDDTQKTYRFKPAYVKVEEAIDPLRPLTFAPGIDRSMLNPNRLTPTQRRALLKAEMTMEAIKAIERRWEWMKARAIIDGKVTIVYDSGESVLVDFQRAAAHTESLGSGNRFGEAGVVIMDKIQAILDIMNNAEFGAVPVRITMGGGVASVLRKDAEFLKHFDTPERPGGTLVMDRALVLGGPNGGKVYKFGELTVGGASGLRIELWVNNETYTDNAGVQQRYLGNHQMVFTGSPDTVMGYECFGMIVDQDADYQAIPIFPKNFTTGDDVKVEHLSFKSAPLPVPIAPNATFLLNAIAP